MVKVFINITLSKVMAFLILLLAFLMDLLNDRAGTVFMFAVPFVVALILNKQWADKGVDKNTQ